MATDKLFTVVGTSTLNGETKVRFANDVLRVKVLEKHGHTNVNLIELETAMTKLDAARFIQGVELFQGEVEQMAIADYIERNTLTPKAAKAPKAKVEIKAPKAKAPVVAVEADDDKPIGYAELEAAVGEAEF